MLLKVNGEVVNEGTGAEEVAGKIALQSEGAPIEFRNIRLAPVQEVGGPAGLQRSALRSPSSSRSSPSAIGRTKAARIGGGITASLPRTDFQRISFSSSSGARSGFARFMRSEACAPGASSRFVSRMSARAGRTE